MQQAGDLASAVHDFLRGLGPQVQDCAPVPVHPESVELLVVVGGVESGLNLTRWTTGGDRRRILPVFPTGSHPEQILPADLAKYNAAFWKDNPAELAATVLSAAGLTPESHRIFISYRRLETEPLAEDLFETLSKLGFDVFLDRFAVPPAAEFQRRLHQDLAEKAMVLLLESDRFGESKWTTEEITYCKRYELGLYSLRLPWGLPQQGQEGSTQKLAGVLPQWRDDLTRAHFTDDPRKVASGGSDYLQWGRLTDSARQHLGNEIRRRHDAAMLRRRDNMRTQLLTELDKQSPGARYRERADGLVSVTSRNGRQYVVWITPRPPELPDFHATHVGCQFPAGMVGVIVGLKSLLEPEMQRRLKWLSGVCKLVLVDQGHILSASRKIAEGSLA